MRPPPVYVEITVDPSISAGGSGSATVSTVGGLLRTVVYVVELTSCVVLVLTTSDVELPSVYVVVRVVVVTVVVVVVTIQLS